jgi:hypothetical protein
MSFTDQERAHYAAIIWSDAVQSMRIILEQAQQLGVSLGPTTLGSEIASYRNLVMSTTPDTIYMEDEDNDREFMKEYVLDMHHNGTHNVDPDENEKLLGMSGILCDTLFCWYSRFQALNLLVMVMDSPQRTFRPNMCFCCVTSTANFANNSKRCNS